MVLTETFLDDRGWQRGQRLCEQLLFDARHVGDRADRAGPARLGGARRREDRTLHPGAGGSGSAIRGSTSSRMKSSILIRELVDPDRRSEDLPLLTYLQGGPGGASPRPVNGSGGWLGEALKHYRVILVDQRGTGSSTPIEAVDVQARGDADAGADYLSMFRADSIVRDLEHVRITVYQ